MLRQIVKSKKIKYKSISDALGFGYGSIAGYLTGQQTELSLERAKAMESYILSL